MFFIFDTIKYRFVNHTHKIIALIISSRTLLFKNDKGKNYIIKPAAEVIQ
jgi:hypothetical protein